MMRRMITAPWDPSNYLNSLPTSSNKKLHEANQRIAAFVRNLIQERKNKMAQQDSSDEPQDLLTNLIRASHGQQGVFSEEAIADVVKSLLFAGFETSSTALTFALFLIAKNPEVEMQCIKEISAANGGTNSEDFPYLNAVVTETLRLYPPAISTTRSLDRDVDLAPNDWGDQNTQPIVTGDYAATIHVPKGTYLYFPIWTIQRHSKNFDDPTAFRPERWVNQEAFCSKGSDSLAKGYCDAFVAFSSGGRSCAGAKFAMQEMVIVLSILLKEFKFELKIDNGEELQVHREGFVICPKEHIAMAITRR